MSLLQNKVALITGGTRGIGKAIVETFMKEGANVAFTFLNSDNAANQIVIELETKYPTQKIMAFKSNAASFANAEELVKQVLANFNTLDILVNNAGNTQDNLLLRMTENQWDSIIEQNLKSVFNLTKHSLKQMLKQRKGSIINLSSIVGITGNAGQSNYTAAKAGIIGFSKSMAQEVGSRNIRCNVIAPGFIETDMTHSLTDENKEQYLKNIPLNRFGTAQEVANVALFLASDLSCYVSGQVMAVCGGLNR